jgi:phosphoribosylformimino-5-aminoimidazole carboxamide ribotide isomerase
VKLFPAIDLLGGRAVRLEEGKRDRATVFHERPVELITKLAHDGADRLHVVDLDGAFGEPRQLDLVAAIIAASPIPVEVGGGIRDRAAVDSVLALGAAFVVLGTAAVRTPDFVEEACRAYPGKIIIAVDARDGIVAVDGWTAAALLYTDVARDGLQRGPNVAATSQLAHAVTCDVIASGGVGALDDLVRLRDAGCFAVVVGRALYDHRFTVAEAAHVAHAVA